MRSLSTHLARARRSVLWIDLGIGAGLFVLGLAIAYLTIIRATQISPIDEITHIDYVWRLMHGQVPHRGDQLSDFALNVWACRGQSNLSDLLPVCGTSDRADFNVLQENYNAWQPPVFFGIIAVMTKVGMALTSFDPVVLMRVSCAVLASSGVVAVYALMRRWSVPRALAAGLSALLLGTLAFSLTASTVSTDAPFLLLGAGAGWILTREVKEHRASWHVAFLIGALSAAVKTISSATILIVAAVLGITGLVRLIRHQDGGWRAGFTALGAVAGAAVVTVAWNHYVGIHTPEGWTNPVLGISTVLLEPGQEPFAQWLATLTSVFGFSRGFWEPTQVTTYVGQLSVGVAAMLLMAAPLLALVASRGEERLLTWVGLIGPVMIVMFVEVQAWLRENSYFGIVSGRYGATLMALTALCLGVGLRDQPRAVRWGFTLVGASVAAMAVLDAAGMLQVPVS